MVALARALALEPRILLLDEPMASLDAASRRRTRSFLRAQLRGRAVPAAIVVTHDPRDVLAIADTVYVMERGRVVQRGTPSELAARPASEFVAELFAPPASDAAPD